MAELREIPFRSALSSFPSGVVIVTTEHEGEAYGFTASSFCSVSADPPLVLTCLAETANCHTAFASTERFVTNVLAEDHGELALRFATKETDKFGGGEFAADEFGLFLPDAVSVVRCTVHTRLEGGDHTILVGQVESTLGADGRPLLYHERGFHRMPRPHPNDLTEIAR